MPRDWQTNIQDNVSEFRQTHNIDATFFDFFECENEYGGTARERHRDNGSINWGSILKDDKFGF